MPRRARIGGVAQEAPATRDSLLDTVLAADTERASLMAEAETAARRRTASPRSRPASPTSTRIRPRPAPPSILNGLGFDAAAQARACAEFSGGWRMRVALAAVLFARPDVLLLDEPTNYLDLEGAIWLETFLARYPHTVLVISHDRDLLNRSVGAILHLDRRKLTLYQGPYDTFEDTRRARLEQLVVREAQAGRRARPHAGLRRPLPRQGVEGAPGAEPDQGARADEADRGDRRGPGDAAFNFPTPEELSPPIIRLEDVSVGYGGPAGAARPRTCASTRTTASRSSARTARASRRCAKLLSDRLAPMAGRKVASSKLRVGYFAQHQVDELDPRRDAAPAPRAAAPRRAAGQAARPARRRRHRRRHRRRPRSAGSRAGRSRASRCSSPRSTRRT